MDNLGENREKIYKEAFMFRNVLTFLNRSYIKEQMKYIPMEA